MTRAKKTGLAFVVLALLAASARALITSYQIPFQGKLITPGTNLPVNGTVNLKFSFYSVPSAGTAIFSETQNSVPVSNGVFSVQIGTITALPASLFAGTSVYLGVTVNTDAEMSPRQQLTMVGYAFTAMQLSNDQNIVINPGASGAASSTFTTTGNLLLVGGVQGSSGSFTNGVTASSGTFTASGVTQFSIATSSGVSVGGTGGVTATYFSGAFYGNGAGLSGVGGVLSGGSSGYLPKWTGTNAEGLSNFWETASSDTALGSAGLAVLGSTFTVGGASFTVTGGSATVAYGLTAASATFNSISNTTYGLTVSSGVEILAGTVDINGAGGIDNAYGLLTGTLTVSGPTVTVGGSSFTVTGGSATVAYGLTAASATFSSISNTTYGLTVSSGIVLQAGTLDVNGAGGITNTYGLFTGTVTVTGPTVTVGGSSFTVTAGSATVAYGLTASSASLTAASNSTYGLSVSSGIVMPNGNVQIGPSSTRVLFDSATANATAFSSNVVVNGSTLTFANPLGSYLSTAGSSNLTLKPGGTGKVALGGEGTPFTKMIFGTCALALTSCASLAVTNFTTCSATALTATSVLFAWPQASIGTNLGFVQVSITAGTGFTVGCVNPTAAAINSTATTLNWAALVP